MRAFYLFYISIILIFPFFKSSAYEVIKGEVFEITGPDDLDLDPENVLIAVDSFGNNDSLINDVTFYTDRLGFGDLAISEGSVEKDGVTITTTAPNQIDNWANAPAFIGIDSDSAFNLSEVMRDIRWNGAPNPLTVDISGLVGGSNYNLKFLLNEGGDRDRGWDISGNDELIVDNFTSEGGDGVWTPENSFVYSVNLEADVSGNISVSFQNDIGGEPQVSIDGNPILQGIILTSTAPSEDSDNDGLPDVYEERLVDNLDDLNGNAEGPGPGSGTGDFDGDGISDIDEFEEKKTDPTKVDTDGDGLNDNVESDTGEYVSISDTGTSPRNSDSDNDGLNDGIETNTGKYVSDDDRGTDPNNRDSDGDGVKDGVDIDPLDPNLTIDTVKIGQVTTFTGPDDINLEPSTAVIAVDVFGNMDSTINGVEFYTDRSGLGTASTSEGVVEKDGVIVTTTATNSIDNWAAAQTFVGNDVDSTNNLSEVMRDIRWSAAPNPITIDVDGLIPGALYEIQLLFNEGADRNRGWDIAVNETLVVDNITSEGIQDVDTWASDLGAMYSGNFNASESGSINVEMRNNIGGLDQVASDGNPILQGIVVHLAVPPRPFEITNIDLNEGVPSITFNSIPGAVYAVDSLEFNRADKSYFWVELDDGLTAEDTETTFIDEFVNKTLKVNMYRIRKLE
tara:strand:+ start:2267 stop:4300 length:2034 start_codon:yes stop_codon:yes gene_type:complete